MNAALSDSPWEKGRRKATPPSLVFWAARRKRGAIAVRRERLLKRPFEELATSTNLAIRGDSSENLAKSPRTAQIAGILLTATQ